MATGLPLENRINFEGDNFVEYYSSFETDPERYEGKTVLILGRGELLYYFLFYCFSVVITLSSLFSLDCEPQTNKTVCLTEVKIMFALNQLPTYFRRKP